mgnify:FL=1
MVTHQKMRLFYIKINRIWVVLLDSASIGENTNYEKVLTHVLNVMISITYLYVVLYFTMC